MRAVRIEGPGSVALVDVPEPVPVPGEVAVRVGAVSACGTDLRMARLGSHAPRIPGHEVAGWLPDGTPVGVHPNLGCGDCPACAAGLENRCPRHVDVGIQRDGGLAEVVAVPAAHAIPLGDLPVRLAPSLESLACVLHANAALGIASGGTAVVVGAGSIGVLGAWAMLAAGARVVVVQRSRARRELARSLGLDAIGPDEDPAAVLGEAPGAALVAAPGADALAWALERVAVGGRVHVFASTTGGAGVDANVVHYRHLALVGSTGSTLADYRRALELARTGAVPLDRLPTREIPLEEMPAVLRGERDDRGILKYVAAPSA